MIYLPFLEAVPNATGSAFRSLHMQQSDSSSSEELSVSGKTTISYQLRPGKLLAVGCCLVIRVTTSVDSWSSFLALWRLEIKRVWCLIAR